jgi:hypothetical protein
MPTSLKIEAMNQDPKSRGLIYAARMRYLQSREGRKSGLKFASDNRDDQLYLTRHKYCKPGILTTPPEVATCSRAFKQAYWRYHCKLTVRSIQELLPPRGKEPRDNCKERLSGKRQDISAKVRSREAQRSRTVTMRKAEIALSGHGNSSI